MTTASFHHLMQTGSVLMIAVLALGVLFEHLSGGWRRNALVGFLCGIFAALTVPLALPGGHATIDGRVPLVLVAGILGGPLAAGVAIPLPLLAGVLPGEAPPVPGALPVLIAASLGAGIRALCEALRIPPGRRTVACAAIASPATVAVHGNADLAGGMAALVPLAAWTAAATLVGGILAANELSRGEMLRDIRRAARLRSATGHVAADVLDGQLRHYWSLHERHGVQYAFLLVSIDDAPAQRDRLGAAEWERLVERSAAALRRSVRATDTCAPIDFDRFGVLLPHATLALAIPVAERVRANLARAGVSVSIGVADAESTGGVADVRACAEAALYAALAEASAGVIGPPPQAVRPAAPRSFPGALVEPSEGGDRRRAARAGQGAADASFAA